MRKIWLALFLCIPAMAQVSNPSIILVTTAPSGACTAGLPNQQVATTGTQYSCQNGIWGAIGGGSGTVSGTTGYVGAFSSATAIGNTISGASQIDALSTLISSGPTGDEIDSGVNWFSAGIGTPGLSAGIAFGQHSGQYNLFEYLPSNFYSWRYGCYYPTTTVITGIAGMTNCAMIAYTSGAAPSFPLGVSTSGVTTTGTSNGYYNYGYTGTPAAAPGTNTYQVSPALPITTPWSFSPAVTPFTGVPYYTNTSGVVQEGSATAAQISSLVQATDLGTITYNASGTTTFAAASNSLAAGIVTATHSTSTTFSPTGLVKWGSYTLEIKQDTTGGGTTFTLGTAGTCSAWKMGGGGAGAITLSTAASAIDILAFTYDGTNCIANFRTNFN